MHDNDTNYFFNQRPLFLNEQPLIWHTFFLFCGMTQMLNKKTTVVLWHVFVWLVLWFTISLWASEGKELSAYLLKNIAIVVPMIGIVYINWFGLFPNFFATKQYWQYFLLVLLLIYIIFYISEIMITEWVGLINPDRLKKVQDYNPYVLPTSFWLILRGAAPFTLGLLCSTIILAIQQKHQDEKETAVLRLENAQHKIQYLQSQISPHFLFNSLNNVHSLILKDQGKASEYIIKLSDLLRFMIYQTNNDFITLGEEIDLVKKYVILADYRIGNTVVSDNLKISIENNELKLPPLLIFGILENGIKHSGMGVEDTFNFNMQVKESQGALTVELNNSISTQKFDSKKKGFGIESLKKRLEMYYPKQHNFVFAKTIDHADTVLTINLKAND